MREEFVNRKAMGDGLESTLNIHNVLKMNHLYNHKMKGLSDYCYVGTVHIVKSQANSVSDYCNIGLMTVGLSTCQNVHITKSICCYVDTSDCPARPA